MRTTKIHFRTSWRAAACGLCLALTMILSTSIAAAENAFESAAGAARADLEAALNELKEVREQIAAEKIPLVRRQRELEAEAANLRREFERQLRLRDTRQVELDSLRSEAGRREDQHHYQRSLLTEYLRELESTLPVSEMETFAPQLRATRGDSNAENAPSLQGELAAARLALERIRDQIGGRTYPGEAAGPDGAIESGQFLEVGPVVLFSNDRFAGFAGERIGSFKAHIVAPGRDHERLLRELVEEGRGLLPLDPTLGQATLRAEARASLGERVRAGGVVMIPILVLALGALGVAVIKWIQIAGMQVASPDALQGILADLEKGENEKAGKQARAVRGPVGELLAVAVEHANQRKEILEEILYEKILRTQPRLERYLPFLALTAAAAPLLGLLGTVTGMINTFQLITLFGTGDARTLSGGISEALITTQFGLGVAIAALLVHALLSRKAKGVIANMEQTEAALLNGLSESGKSSDD